MGDALPGPPAVAGFEILGISGVPNRGVLRVRGANPAKILRAGRRFRGWQRSRHRSFYLLRIFHLVQGAGAGHSLRSIIVLILSLSVLRLRERGLNISALGFFFFP